ncbi:TetR/AcrR family transcriptional regulator [Beggiatoa alba]|nr:TetR/AcrR family transcriptional regulator [Beggiatoa alba]
MTDDPTNNTPDPSEDIRARILEAASQRFAQFGYNKTTMAEIAQDCDMSAANLYRFFKNKLDIGANLATNCLDTKLVLIADIIKQQDRPAAERLHDVVLHTLRYTHGQWSNDPRMNEMVNAICEARMDIVDTYKLSKHDLLVNLLEDGVQRGEFSIHNLDDTAEAIASAITAFCLPLLMPMYSLDIFEKRAESVVQLLLNGLIKR